MKLTKKTIYIGLFSVLYLIVAFSSFFHACAFFGLANNTWMSVILAFAFEVGQAAVLFSLLTSQKDRTRVMPWVLMTMFTLVQVIGNIYSSYKYIITNSVENLRYFKEPIFVWTELPDAQANVIIVYLVGALLPIAALFLTSMITNYLTDQQEEQKLLESNNKEITEIKEELKHDDRQETEDKSDNDNEEQQLGGTEDKGSTESELSEKSHEQESYNGKTESGVDEIIQEGTEIEKDAKKKLDKESIKETDNEVLKKRNSHFINL